jgi:hypothetical protein
LSTATRKLLLAEAVLLLAPATVLVALGFAWSARFLAASVRDGNWQDPTTWMSMAIAAGLVGILSGWWLLVRYLRSGPAALKRGAGMAWAGAAIGLVAALGGAWMFLLGNGWIFAMGLVALLPLAHLWRLRDSEKSR